MSRLKLSTTEAILLKELLNEHSDLLSEPMNHDQTKVMKSASQERMITQNILARVEGLLGDEPQEAEDE